MINNIKVLGNYTHEELIRIYAKESGDIWKKVDDLVDNSVPKTIVINEKCFNHMSVYFDAVNLTYAYFNYAHEENHGFIFLTKEQINAIMENNT